MKTKKTGFNLINMLTAMMLVAAVIAMAAPLFASLAQGMTRGTRTVATDRTIDHMLDRLRQDVRGARAVALTGSDGNEVALGAASDRIRVRYAIVEGNVIRTPADGGQTCWTAPDAAIELRLWPPQGPPQALEVRTSVAEVANSVTTQKLARTHLFFFAGVEGRAGK